MGWLVMTEGMPVTTPRESVIGRNEVNGLVYQTVSQARREWECVCQRAGAEELQRETERWGIGVAKRVTGSQRGQRTKGTEVVVGGTCA